MAYRWIEHTSELELELEAVAEEGIFEAGFDAMRELMATDDAGRLVEVPVELTERDRPALLADWLGELAFLGETRALVPEELVHLELEEDGMRATVRGREGTPPHLVKSATYHRLMFERANGTWAARVVLDV